ncbi:MAG: DNA polymerase IV [Deltaproteobacteria bacterium]
MSARSVMHVDMDAFFASVEQRCSPALRGKPIAVTGPGKRTVVTTASYEARRFGVKTGMNRYEAKRACPSIIFVIGDNRKYMDASVRILDVIRGFSPMVEPYSIDEAFADITGSTPLFGPCENIAFLAKERIRHATGLTCSIGIAPNKLLAKLASGMKKPDGLVIIKEDGVRALFKDLPVSELWGVGPSLTARLSTLGITTCAELGACPASVLRERFGIIGERLKLMGQGIDPSPVIPMGEEEEAKSVGHSTTLQRDVSDRETIKRYILKLSEMAGKRARAHNLNGRKVSLTLRYPDFFTFSRQRTLPCRTNDTRAVYRTACDILGSIRLKHAVRLIGVCISDMAKDTVQLPLFEDDRRRRRLLDAMDGVNDRYGDFTLTWGTLLEMDGGDKDGAGVISPAWRPAGVRRVDVR